MTQAQFCLSYNILPECVQHCRESSNALGGVVPLEFNAFTSKLRKNIILNLKNKMILDFRKPLPQIFSASNKKMNYFLNSSDIDKRNFTY